MAKSIYVYSTLSASVDYIQYEHREGLDRPLEVEGRNGVLIAGGTGVANKNLITPIGVVTRVTEAQMEYLRGVPVFQLHEKNGFVQVRTDKVDPEVAAADMVTRDESAPLNDADFEEGKAPVVVGDTAAAPEPAPRRRRA